MGLVVVDGGGGISRTGWGAGGCRQVVPGTI